MLIFFHPKQGVVGLKCDVKVMKYKDLVNGPFVDVKGNPK